MNGLKYSAPLWVGNMIANVYAGYVGESPVEWYTGASAGAAGLSVIVESLVRKMPKKDIAPNAFGIAFTSACCGYFIGGIWRGLEQYT